MRTFRGCLMAALAVVVTAGFLFEDAAAKLMPNSAVTRTGVFNDCPFSTPTVVNNYPASILIRDDCPDCGPFGFANLHNWTYSTDGVNGMVVNNNDGFRFGAWVNMSGTTNGEAGMRLSVWYAQEESGRFNIRVPDGEIAVFGGRLPFYSFTGNHGITYVRGQPIYLEMTYHPNGLSSTSPGTIEYVVGWGGNTYTSGPLAFDEGNPDEDPPYGLWGCLNEARAGGYFQPFINHAGMPAIDLQAEFTDVAFEGFPAVTPCPNSAATRTGVFNDCPFSTPTVVNNYPASVLIQDDCPDCGPFGFANLHNWTYSTDGVNGMVLNNNHEFRFGAWVNMSGTTNGEAGMRLSVWYAQEESGRFNIRVPDGEIAVFGGRLPFYSFTGNHGITYVRGQPIYLEMTYHPNGLSSTSPGTIEYVVGWGGNTYTSGPLPFDMGNDAEDPPHGLWGILNDARAGGYFQPFINHAGMPAIDLQAEFTDIVFGNDFAPPEVTCNVTPGPGNSYVIDYTVDDGPGDTCPGGPATVNAYIDTGCLRVPVTAGQVVKIKCEDDDSDSDGDSDNGHGHGNGPAASNGQGDDDSHSDSDNDSQSDGDSDSDSDSEGDGDSDDDSQGSACPVKVRVKNDHIMIKHAPSASLVVEVTDAAGNTTTCISPICRAHHRLARQRAPHGGDPGVAALLPLSAPRDRTQTLEFRLPDAGSVTLDVFDVAGRRVQRLVESYESAGLHRVEWDTSVHPTGIYFYQLRSGTVLKTQKVAVIH